MRMLLKVTLPHDTFNAAVRDGTVGRKLNRILEELKPEAVYFTEFTGKRTAVIVVDLADPRGSRCTRSRGFSPSMRTWNSAPS